MCSSAISAGTDFPAVGKPHGKRRSKNDGSPGDV